MLAKYGCIMLSAILQKHVLHHNFWTEAHRMMILGVLDYVVRVKELVGTGHFDHRSLCLPVCLSVCLSVHPSYPPSVYQSDCWSLSAFSWSVNRSALLSPAWPCEALRSPARPCLVPLGPTYPCLAPLSPAKSRFAPLNPALPRLAPLSLVRPCLAPLYPVWRC